jgi:hypothetical protein
MDFPSLATTRTPWRSHDIGFTGDAELAERILDATNLI